MSVKICFIFSSNGPFVRHSQSVCSILEEDIMRNISVTKNIEFGPAVLEEMPFKHISYLELWKSLYSAEQNRLCSFRPGDNVEHFREIVLNLDQWFQRRGRYKIVLI